MAVLEKRLGVQLGDCDAYVNVAGGMRITEPAIDLAIVTAILSSFRNITINSSTIIFGEVGLTGEIRAVNMADQRVAEAAKMGFKTCILPKANEGNIKATTDIKLIGVKNLQEVLDSIKESK
jgi:DNA repair protein RadA/Sms